MLRVCRHAYSPTLRLHCHGAICAYGFGMAPTAMTVCNKRAADRGVLRLYELFGFRERPAQFPSRLGGAYTRALRVDLSGFRRVAGGVHGREAMEPRSHRLTLLARVAPRSDFAESLQPDRCEAPAIRKGRVLIPCRTRHVCDDTARPPGRGGRAMLRSLGGRRGAAQRGRRGVRARLPSSAFPAPLKGGCERCSHRLR
eukprot:6195041-Pleurochrysis_carterae.AAC.2